MIESLLQRIDDDDIHLIVHKFGVVATFVIEEELHLSFHRSQQLVQLTLPVFMDEQRVERITNTDAAGLRIIDNGLSFLQVAILVEINMHHASTRLNNRDAGRITYEVDELASTTRDAEIYVSYCIQHLACSLVGGRQQSYDIL